MANPLTDFLNLTDQFGTNVSDLAVDFTGGVTSMVWRMGAEFVTAIVQLALVFAIFILNLIVNQGLFVEIAGSMYQVILDYVYKYINPWIIATAAFAILVARIYVGDKVTKDDKTGRFVRYELNHTNITWGDLTKDSPDEKFRKKVVSQFGNTAILMAVIAVAMANPFTLLSKAFGLINEFVRSVAPDGVGVSPQVDGVLVPVLHLVNFQGQLTPDCNARWSATLAAGGDVSDLACLTAEQHDAATAGVVTFLISLASILMIGGFAYFAWAILCRFSWLLFRMITHVFVLPWHAALLIANPGNERKKLDTVSDHLREAVTSLFWILVTVFVAQIVPAAVFNAMGSVTDRWRLPSVLQLLIASAVLYGCGKAVHKYIGKKWKHKDGVRTPAPDGTTGWSDYVTNGRGKVLTEAFAKANQDSAAELAMSAAVVAGTHTATQRSAPGERSVRTGVAVDPAMDAAASTVNLTAPQSAMVQQPGSPTQTGAVPASGSVAGGAATGGSAQSEVGEAAQSATDIAAAATAAVLAAGEQEIADPIGDSATGVADTAVSPDALSASGAAGAAAATSATVVVAVARDAGHGHRTDESGGVSVSAAAAAAAVGSGTEPASDATVEPGTAAAVLDPEAKRHQLINEYTDALGRFADHPDGDPQVTVVAPEQLEPHTFDRITRVYAEPAGTGNGPTDSGVTGGSGEFVSCTQRRLEWKERKILALTLGMRADPPLDEAEEKQPEITFYSSSEDGNNRVKFRGRDGFGDGI